MHSVLIAASAALLAMLPAVQAKNATVFNQCNFNVYYTSVSADGGSGVKVLAPGQSYSELYKLPSQGGVSIKLSNTESMGQPITQFEYTVKTPQTFYDISNVDCVGNACPFSQHGMYMEAGQGCPTRSCAPGEAPCKGAYTLFNDDQNTVACDCESDIKLYLCKSAPPKKRDLDEVEAFGVPSLRRHVRRHVHSHDHA